MILGGLSHSPDSAGAVIPQFLAAVGMDNEVTITSDESNVVVTISDGTVITVTKPKWNRTYSWVATMIAPGFPPVTFDDLNFGNDSFRLAAWVAEMVFTTLDTLQLQVV